jgi:hypothetical protein
MTRSIPAAEDQGGVVLVVLHGLLDIKGSARMWLKSERTQQDQEDKLALPDTQEAELLLAGEQLAKLRTALESVFPNCEWRLCPWIIGEEQQSLPGKDLIKKLVFEPIRHLEGDSTIPSDESYSGTFKLAYTAKIDRWLSAQIAKIDKVRNGTPIHLVAYSAGAFLVYAWLSTQNSSEKVERFERIVCIAGPYRFEDEVRTGPPYRVTLPSGTIINVREAPLLPQDICQHLNKAKQLIVLLAANDETVKSKRKMGTFSDYALGDKVIEGIITGADHLTIITDQAADTARSVVEFMN